MNPISPKNFVPMNFDSDSEAEMDVTSEISESLKGAQAKTAAFIDRVMPAARAREEELQNLRDTEAEMASKDPFAGIKQGIEQLRVDKVNARALQGKQLQALDEMDEYYKQKILKIKELSEVILPELTNAVKRIESDQVAATLYTVAEKGASNMAGKGAHKENSLGKSYYNMPQEEQLHLLSLARDAKELIERIEREEKEFVRKSKYKA